MSTINDIPKAWLHICTHWLRYGPRLAALHYICSAITAFGSRPSPLLHRLYNHLCIISIHKESLGNQTKAIYIAIGEPLQL